MSPKKDVTCKHIGPKQYEVHATHFLFESQVGFCFCKLHTFQGANNNLFDN